MSFMRPLVRKNGFIQPMNSGDGMAANYAPVSDATDADTILTAEVIAGGLLLRSGASSPRTLTTVTAALIAAAFPDMNVGDTYSFKLVNHNGIHILTVAGGTGVTLVGNGVLGPNMQRELIFHKTAAATFDLIMA